jgi:ribosome-associated protein
LLTSGSVSSSAQVKVRNRDQAMTLMKEIILSKQPVELFKILKFEGMASSGGEAKMMIADGQVEVNGAIELRKRKQIVADDIIEFGGEKFVVRLQP